jgi:hypothetical protein
MRFLGAFEAAGSRRALILACLLGVCALIYYFGELVDIAGWDSLRWGFFYGVHDTQRLLFLAPILYAGYFFRTKGALIATLVSLIVCLPRAILISHFPYPLAREVAFMMIAGALGVALAKLRSKYGSPRTTESRADANEAGRLHAATEETRAFLTFGYLEVHLANQMVKRHGQVVKLTRTEYALLAYLISNAGRVVSHTEILQRVWGPEYGTENEYLRTFIGQLRRKLEDDPSNPCFIRTEPRQGYRFVPPT